MSCIPATQVENSTISKRFYTPQIRRNWVACSSVKFILTDHINRNFTHSLWMSIVKSSRNNCLIQCLACCRKNMHCHKQSMLLCLFLHTASYRGIPWRQPFSQLPNSLLLRIPLCSYALNNKSTPGNYCSDILSPTPKSRTRTNGWKFHVFLQSRIIPIISKVQHKRSSFPLQVPW